MITSLLEEPQIEIEPVIKAEPKAKIESGTVAEELAKLITPEEAAEISEMKVAGNRYGRIFELLVTRHILRETDEHIVLSNFILSLAREPATRELSVYPPTPEHLKVFSRKENVPREAVQPDTEAATIKINLGYAKHTISNPDGLLLSITDDPISHKKRAVICGLIEMKSWSPRHGEIKQQLFKQTKSLYRTIEQIKTLYTQLKQGLDLVDLPDEVDIVPKDEFVIRVIYPGSPKYGPNGVISKDKDLNGGLKYRVERVQISHKNLEDIDRLLGNVVETQEAPEQIDTLI